MNPTDFNWAEDLFTPIGIAIISLALSAIYQIIRQRASNKNSKISVLDNLIISLNVAVEKLEQLKEDAITDLFKYENRTTAERVANRLKDLGYQTEVLTDSNLRRSILEYTDGYLSLIEDINGLEVYSNGKYNQFNDQKKSSLDELRLFKLDLIKMGYKLGEDTTVISLIPSSAQEPIATALTGVYQDLNGKFIEARNELDNANSFSKDRRVHLAIRIVDTQTKLRELNSKLQISRDALVNSWFNA